MYEGGKQQQMMRLNSGSDRRSWNKPPPPFLIAIDSQIWGDQKVARDVRMGGIPVPLGT